MSCAVRKSPSVNVLHESSLAQNSPLQCAQEAVQDRGKVVTLEVSQRRSSLVGAHTVHCGHSWKWTLSL